MNIQAEKLELIGLILRTDDIVVLKKIRAVFNEAGIKNTNNKASKEKQRKVR
jgi:hypothetical protein